MGVLWFYNCRRDWGRAWEIPQILTSRGFAAACLLLITDHQVTTLIQNPQDVADSFTVSISALQLRGGKTTERVHSNYISLKIQMVPLPESCC
jgi:hypothetical protein